MPRHTVITGFCYVYLPESRWAEGGFYTGTTDDLAARLAEGESCEEFERRTGESVAPVPVGL